MTMTDDELRWLVDIVGFGATGDTYRIIDAVPTLLDRLAAQAGEIERLRTALQAILVPTNFISLCATRDYVSEILGVGPYAS